MGEASTISSTTPRRSWVRLYLSASVMVARATTLLRHSGAGVVQGVADAGGAADAFGDLVNGRAGDAGAGGRTDGGCNAWVSGGDGGLDVGGDGLGLLDL